MDVSMKIAKLSRKKNVNAQEENKPRLLKLFKMKTRKAKVFLR
jgi:hypothetical protein